MSRELLKAIHKQNVNEHGVYRREDILCAGISYPIYIADMLFDGSTSVTLSYPASIDVYRYDDRTQTSLPTNQALSIDDNQILVVQAPARSEEARDIHLILTFRSSKNIVTWSAELTLTAIEIALFADFDRDGKVDRNRPRAHNGAILLVNSDRDTAYPSPHFRDRLDRRINGPLDLEDMTPMEVIAAGPQGVDLSTFELRLHASDAAASRIRAFDVSGALSKVMIGPGQPVARFPMRYATTRIAIEGIDYPDAGFSGLVTIQLDAVRDDEVYGSDVVVLRVAPWLALPNTQPVERLFIADMEDGSNAETISDMRKVAAAAGLKLEIVPPKRNRGDRWLQDEIEIGFASSPGKRISVVLDSPRDRGLDDFPETELLGPDFAYVTRGNDLEANSLDSFGNLDCTPPHKSPKGEFPFGRIVFGGAQPGNTQGRRMMKIVRDFLYAQGVQGPIELFSDWLNVGHVDEFMSFVSASDRQGFRLVLADPYLAYEILEKLRRDGHGNAVLLAGTGADISVKDVLGNNRLREQNDNFQRYIDWNKSVLVEEMGLQAADIIRLPALYDSDHSDGRADAFFPNMVNMQVLGKHLAIPKPFGPNVNGVCAFEKIARDSLEHLGLNCHFVDTYKGYHIQQGEIHCGTNVVRTAFTRNWWDYEPTE